MLRISINNIEQEIEPVSHPGGIYSQLGDLISDKESSESKFLLLMICALSDFGNLGLAEALCDEIHDMTGVYVFVEDLSSEGSSKLLREMKKAK